MANNDVCIITPSFNSKDGIARVVSEIAWYLKERAVIFTFSHDASRTYEILNTTKVFEVKSNFSNKFLKFLHRFFIGIWKIKKYINKRKDISVLNPHGIHPIIFASIVKILSFNRKLKNSAFIYDKEEIAPKRKLYIFLIKFFLKTGALDEILVLDNPMAKLSREILNTDKVKIIRIGISHSFLELSKKEKLFPSENIKKTIEGETRIKLFFNGILIPRRRIEDLLSAFSLLIKNNKIDAYLYIGGSLHFNDQYVKFIYKLVENLQLTNQVYFLDRLSEEDLAYMYKSCDIFIFPPNEQTWGLAPLEAMLFAKPVIVSTGCGVSEVLDKNTAVLVPPKQPVLIAEAVISLINNKNMWENMGVNAQNYVLKKFTFASTADELKKLWWSG